MVLAYPTEKQGPQSLPELSSPWPEEVAEGHLCSSGGLETPRGSSHPGSTPIHNAQASCCNRGYSQVASYCETCGECRPVHSSCPPDIVTMCHFACVSSTLVRNLGWLLGDGAVSRASPHKPGLAESPTGFCLVCLTSDPPSSTPWTLGTRPMSSPKKPSIWPFCLGLCDLSQGPCWLALTVGLVQ